MPRRTGEVRASSTMVPSHAANIARPVPPPQATVFDGADGPYVKDRNGSRHYLGVGCLHMSASRGESTSGVCHIPECRVNIRTLRAAGGEEKPASGPETAEQEQSGALA